MNYNHTNALISGTVKKTVQVVKSPKVIQKQRLVGIDSTTDDTYLEADRSNMSSGIQRYTLEITNATSIAQKVCLSGGLQYNNHPAIANTSALISTNGSPLQPFVGWGATYSAATAVAGLTAMYRRGKSSWFDVLKRVQTMPVLIKSFDVMSTSQATLEATQIEILFTDALNLSDDSVAEYNIEDYVNKMQTGVRSATVQLVNPHSFDASTIIFVTLPANSVTKINFNWGQTSGVPLRSRQNSGDAHNYTR